MAPPRGGSKIRYILIGLAGTICILIFLFLLFHRHFYAISADESGRVRMADQWCHQPTFLLHAWLPLPQVIMGAALRLHHDLFQVPRLLSGLLGLLTWLATVWLARELFCCSAITLITALLVALLPDRVIAANIPLSEIYFFCFVTTGCAALARYLRQPSLWVLWLGAFCLGLGNGCRYDSWVFSALFCALAAWHGLRQAPRPSFLRVGGRLLGPTLLVAAFPLVWMIAWKLQRGNSTNFSRHVLDEYFFLFGTSYLRRLRYGPLVQFLYGNLITLNCLGLWSLVQQARTNPRLRLWLLAPALTLLAMSVAAFNGFLPSHNFWRLGALWSILLTPFTAHFIWSVSPRLLALLHRPPHQRPALAAALTIILMLVFTVHILLRTTTSSFDVDQLHVANYFKQRFATEHPPQPVLIDSSTWAYLNIAVASNYPDLFVPSAGNYVGHQGQDFFAAPPDLVRSRLRVNRFSYIAISKPALKQTILNNFPHLRPVQSYGPWTIYYVDLKLPQAPVTIPFVQSLPLRRPPLGSYANPTPLQLTLNDRMPDALRQQWDGASHNVIYITNTRWGPQMIFDLQLFEELIIDAPDWPARHFFNNRRINADLWQWQEQPDGWHFSLDQREVLDVRVDGRVWASGPQQVKIEGTIFNRMEQPWSTATGLICLRTRNAVPFVNTDYQRIFLTPRANPSSSVTVRELLGTSFDPRLPAFDYFNFWVRKPGAPQFLPAIRKIDATGKRQVRLETSPAISVGGSRLVGANCIHSNLALDIASQGSQHFVTTIDFLETP